MEALLEEMEKMIVEENKKKKSKEHTFLTEIQRLKEENLALTDKNLALADKNLALTDKNIALADKNLALADKNLALESKLLVLESKLLVLPEQMNSNGTVVLDVPPVASPVSVEIQKTELVCAPPPVDIVVHYPLITCSYNGDKLCISSVGDLVDGIHTSRSVRIRHEHGENGLALAFEISESESDNPMRNETDSFIIDNYFTQTTVWVHEEQDSFDVGIFQPFYDKHIDNEQEDEADKDDLMYYGYYDRTAYRYVIPYSLLLSFLEDKPTKTLCLSDIPEIEMFEDRCISNDIICRKLNPY
jgi:hypothetical protein